MNKDEIIKYLKNNPKELFDICEALNLRFPYENKEELMEIYNFLVKTRKYASEQNDKEYKDNYNTLNQKIKEMEEQYHIFEPEFDNIEESRWIPKEYNEDALELFQYRKQMFNTEHIWHDKELDDIIKSDICDCWEEKNGQDGMYKSFPFTKSFKSTVRTSEKINYYSKQKEYYVTDLIRSYALCGHGGIAIVEEITIKYDSPECTNKIGTPYSNFHILTLGKMMHIIF